MRYLNTVARAPMARLAPALSLPVLLSPLAAAQIGSQFGTQTELAAVTTPWAMELVDLDDDGDLDVLVGRDGGVTSIENLGFGEYGQPQGLAILSGFSRYVRLATGDLDGDGELDLLAADRDLDAVSVFYGAGATGFEVEQRISTVSNIIDVHAADVDDDGDLDILVTRESFSNDQIQLIENLGSRTFGAAAVVTTAVANPTSIVTADFDMDGVLDMATTSFDDDKVAWYRGLGAGAFGPQQIISTGSDGPNHMSIGDFDEDGRTDLVVASVNDDQVAWFRNTGSGFSNAQLIDTAADGAARVTVSDLDRDGDQDLVVTCSVSDEVRLYENIGFGFFNVPAFVDGVKNNAQHALVADLNGDAAIDVICTSIDSSRIYMNANVGTLGTTYCTSNPNSTGVVGELTVTGSTSLDFNELALTATELPPASFGFFLTSPQQGMIDMPGDSQGVLCLSGAIGRYVAQGEPQFSGITRRFRLRLDAGSRPSPTGTVTVQAGDTWNFQAWHRDLVNGQVTSNFTSAVSVQY